MLEVADELSLWSCSAYEPYSSVSGIAELPAMQALGFVDEAIATYEDIYKVWLSMFSIDNSKTTFVQCNVAQAFWVHGIYAKAPELL